MAREFDGQAATGVTRLHAANKRTGCTFEPGPRKTVDHFPNDVELVEAVDLIATKHWAALVIEGAALVLFGFLALFIPPLITLGVASALGWVLLSAGAAAVIVYFRWYRAQELRYLLFSAILTMIAGVALLAKSFSDLPSVTVVVILCFALAAAAKLTFPLRRFRYLLKYRGWIRTSGIIDLMLAALMLADLPTTAHWAPDLLLGANMILAGVAVIVVALSERRRPISSVETQPRQFQSTSR